jgi:hypothetical protein
MTIERAIKYLSWEAQQKPTPSKVEAINTIIDFVNHTEQQSLMENELFAKLFIEKFIMLAETKHYTAQACLDEIERILSMTTYEMVLKLKEKVPMMKFNAIGQDKYPLKDIDIFNLDAIRERNIKIIDEYTKELFDALKTSYSEDEAIHFVKSKVNYLVNKYQKNDTKNKTA